MKKKVYLLSLLIAATACKKEENDTPKSTPSKYESGVFIVNEGPFMSGSGTLDHYDPATKSLENSIFSKVNNADIGNVFQSATMGATSAYLVANLSGIVRAVDPKTMKLLSSTDAIASPRYVVEINNNRIAVSDWAESKVFILNANTLATEASITTGKGPENMVYYVPKNQLFVVNSGGFESDSTLSIINLNNNTVDNTITLKGSPNSLVLDRNNKLWVLCGGIKDFSNPANNKVGALYRINPDNQTIEATYLFTNPDQSPGRLTKSGDAATLYYLSSSYGGEVMKMNITDTQLPNAGIIGFSAYALGVDPATNDLYLSDPGNYVDPGKVYRYNPNYQVIDTLNAGVIPGNFYFK